MAEYIKFRLTAAKAGVSMALLALVGGLVAKGESGPQRVNAAPASAHPTQFLKLGGVTGNTKDSLLKLESKLGKISGSLASAEAKLSHSYYGKHATDATFEKIKSANAQFLKVADAATKFEKLGATAVNSAKLGGLGPGSFLPAGATAGNAAKLGGLAPSSFLQGRGNVISGAISYVPGTQAQLLMQTAGGIIAVLFSNPAGGAPTLTVHNGTGALLPAVQNYEGANTSVDIPPGDHNLTIGGAASPEQVHLQLFPNANSPAVISITVSLESDPAHAGNIAVVGQMLIGLL